MECFISVGEPWDFESPDGKNIIKGALDIKSDTCAIFKSNYDVEIKKIKSNMFILHPRYEGESFNQLRNNLIPINANIISIDDYNDLSENEIETHSVFVIIGTINKSS